MPNPDSSSPRVSADPGIASQEIIRLSQPSIPACSTEMTQQEKIAAALARAGIPNPADWTDFSPDFSPGNDSVLASTPVADPSQALAKDTSPAPQSSEHSGVYWVRKFLQFGGALLSLISLYLYFSVR